MSLNVHIFCDTITMRYSVCKLLQAVFELTGATPDGKSNFEIGAIMVG